MSGKGIFSGLGFDGLDSVVDRIALKLEPTTTYTAEEIKNKVLELEPEVRHSSFYKTVNNSLIKQGFNISENSSKQNKTMAKIKNIVPLFEDFSRKRKIYEAVLNEVREHLKKRIEDEANAFDFSTEIDKRRFISWLKTAIKDDDKLVSLKSKWASIEPLLKASDTWYTSNETDVTEILDTIFNVAISESKEEICELDENTEIQSLVESKFGNNIGLDKLKEFFDQKGIDYSKNLLSSIIGSGTTISVNSPEEAQEVQDAVSSGNEEEEEEEEEEEMEEINEAVTFEEVNPGDKIIVELKDGSQLRVEAKEVTKDRIFWYDPESKRMGALSPDKVVSMNRPGKLKKSKPAPTGMAESKKKELEIEAAKYLAADDEDKMLDLIIAQSKIDGNVQIDHIDGVTPAQKFENTFTVDEFLEQIGYSEELNEAGKKKLETSGEKEFEIMKNGTAQGTVFAKNQKEAEDKVFATYGEKREVVEISEAKKTKVEPKKFGLGLIMRDWKESYSSVQADVKKTQKQIPGSEAYDEDYNDGSDSIWTVVTNFPNANKLNEFELVYLVTEEANGLTDKNGNIWFDSFAEFKKMMTDLNKKVQAANESKKSRRSTFILPSGEINEAVYLAKLKNRDKIKIKHSTYGELDVVVSKISNGMVFWTGEKDGKKIMGSVKPQNVVKKINERKFSDEKRTELAKSGEAMEDGSFPIVNIEDLKNAVKASGRAKDQNKARLHIIKRAKALNKEANKGANYAFDHIPDGWNYKTGEINEAKLPVDQWLILKVKNFEDGVKLVERLQDVNDFFFDFYSHKGVDIEYLAGTVNHSLESEMKGYTKESYIDKVEEIAKKLGIEGVMVSVYNKEKFKADKNLAELSQEMYEAKTDDVEKEYKELVEAIKRNYGIGEDQKSIHALDLKDDIIPEIYPHGKPLEDVIKILKDKDWAVEGEEDVNEGKKEPEYVVSVGNMGNVLTTENKEEAYKTYREYVTQSGGKGRASGESVTMMKDGEIIREHEGSVNEGKNGRKDSFSKKRRTLNEGNYIPLTDLENKALEAKFGKLTVDPKSHETVVEFNENFFKIKKFGDKIFEVRDSKINEIIDISISMEEAISMIESC